MIRWFIAPSRGSNSTAVGGDLRYHTSGWVRLDQIQSLSTVEAGVILAR